MMNVKFSVREDSAELFFEVEGQNDIIVELLRNPPSRYERLGPKAYIRYRAPNTPCIWNAAANFAFALTQASNAARVIESLAREYGFDAATKTIALKLRDTPSIEQAITRAYTHLMLGFEKK